MTIRVLPKLEATGSPRPDLVAEFFRFMLDYSDLDGLQAGILGARPDVPWIVDIAGPGKAYVYEVMAGTARSRTGDGVVAAANHFVDPAWNLSTPPADHSVSRYNNLLRQAGEAKGSIDAARMMEIRNVRWENGGATFYIRSSSAVIPRCSSLPITRLFSRRVHGRSG